MWRKMNPELVAQYNFFWNSKFSLEIFRNVGFGFGIKLQVLPKSCQTCKIRIKTLLVPKNSKRVAFKIAYY